MKTAREIAAALEDLPGSFGPTNNVQARELKGYETDNDGGSVSTYLGADDARRLGLALIEAADWLDARAEAAR